MKNLITALGLGGFFLLNGCSSKPAEYIEGKVLRELGNLPSLVKSGPGFFAPETVKIGGSYGLKVDTPKGVFIFKVNESTKPLLALEAAIEEGDSIRFPISQSESPEGFKGYECNFSDDRIGWVSSEYITKK